MKLSRSESQEARSSGAERLRGTAPCDVRRSDDAGFTLVELIVVIAIVPLILGAVAAAFIIALQQDTVNKARISDSANSKTATVYFVRDVQGASELTTNDFSTTRTSGPPPVCGVGAGLGNLVVAFFHAPTTSGPALDVAYRYNGTRVTRYSCTYSATNNTSTSPLPVVISEDVASAGNLSVNITPSQFSTPASLGWISVTATTGLIGQQALSSATLNVAGTVGFVPNQPITILTPLGSEQVTCGTVNPTSFATCAGGPTVTALAGALVTQASVAGVQLSMNQSGSNYRFSLNGSPRPSTAGGLGACPTCLFPSLLALGGGVTFQGNSGLTVNVTGGMMLDGGTLSCTPAGYGGAVITGGSSGDTGTTNLCTSPTLALATAPFVPDPISGQLPQPCMPTQPLSPTHTGTPTGVPPTFQPGRYDHQINLSGGSTTYMKPGVYELDDGITLGGSANLLIDPTTPPGQGVLLYIPGPGFPGQPSGCATEDSALLPNAPPVNLSGGGSIKVPPLGTALPASLSSSPILSTMWIWEDGSVPSTTSASLTGNTAGGVPSGIAYLPGTNVTLIGAAGSTTGKIIALSVSLQGSAGITVSGT